MNIKPLLGPCDSYQLEPFAYPWAWDMARAQETTTANEEWRDIPGYPGYQASSLGRVRSLDKQVRCNGGTRIRKGRVLSPVTHHSGYIVYTLHNGGLQKAVFGHRVVMQAFVGVEPENHVTCHKDGNRQNNRLSNLRYDTRTNNEQDKREHGTYQKEEMNPRAVFSLRDVQAIRQLRANGASVKCLAQRFNSRPGHISKICTGYLWPDAPGPITRSHYKNA